jgi:hypothetical protein
MFVGAVLLYVGMVGCGPEPYVDPNRTSISGTVTFNGEPLKAGTITFESKGKGIATSVSIRSEGRYATNRVPLGTNAVSIDTQSVQFGSPKLYVKIPERYVDPSTSGLSADVKPGTNENVNFELNP